MITGNSYFRFASSADVQQATDAINRLNNTETINGFFNNMFNIAKLEKLRELGVSAQEATDSLRQCVQQAEQTNSTLNDMHRSLHNLEQHSAQTNERLAHIDDSLDEMNQSLGAVNRNLEGIGEEQRKGNDRAAWYAFNDWKDKPEGQQYLAWREEALTTISKLKLYTETMWKARREDCLTMTQHLVDQAAFPQKPARIGLTNYFTEPEPQPLARPLPPTLLAVPDSQPVPQRHPVKITLFLIGGAVLGALVAALAITGYMMSASHLADMLAQIPYENLPAMGARMRADSQTVMLTTASLGAIAGLGAGTFAHWLFARKELATWDKQKQTWSTAEEHRKQILQQNAARQNTYHRELQSWNDAQAERQARWADRRQKAIAQCDQENRKAQEAFTAQVQQTMRGCFESANEAIPSETSWCKGVNPSALLNTLTGIIDSEIDDPYKRDQFHTVSPYMPKLADIEDFNTDATPTMKSAMIWITWKEEGSDTLSGKASE